MCGVVHNPCAAVGERDGDDPSGQADLHEHSYTW
ncbi:Uncharacterised protein [Dermatophilus congolensis]|uniref:Uncharacterized protein n=1 Tax=Dermatophilus congolensis TaxID=1863 RepID=A0AA46BLQ8_9MICO|nr:Uncharacterised protein [Dermatophilus congolensis]